MILSKTSSLFPGPRIAPAGPEKYAWSVTGYTTYVLAIGANNLPEESSIAETKFAGYPLQKCPRIIDPATGNEVILLHGVLDPS